jgi:hypothetical protein
MRKRGEDLVVFQDDQLPPVSSRTTDIIAREYIKKLLRYTAPEAINLQRKMMNDPEVDPVLRFKISEAVLDRYMGKSAQEIRLGDTEGRPIVFSEKLRVLREGMEAAEDAVVHKESAYSGFSKGVNRALSPDDPGVII